MRPLIVVEAVWQYSHHVLPGSAPIRPDPHGRQLERPMAGPVGMLNLNGSLTKAGVKYSTLWSVDFKDDFFNDGLRHWLEGRLLRHHDQPRPAASATCKLPEGAQSRPVANSAQQLRQNKAIMGVFDEGCMGMYNAIIPDELLHPTGCLQGAAQPVGAVRGDAAVRPTKRRLSATGWTQRACVRHRPDRRPN